MNKADEFLEVFVWEILDDDDCDSMTVLQLKSVLAAGKRAFLHESEEEPDVSMFVI